MVKTMVSFSIPKDAQMVKMEHHFTLPTTLARSSLELSTLVLASSPMQKLAMIATTQER